MSILWVILGLPHLLAHADKLHFVLVGNPLIICCKDEILGFLGLPLQGKSLPVSSGGTQMQVVSEETRLREITEANVPHVLAEIDKFKYQVRTRCNPELHVLYPQYRTAQESLIRLEVKLEPEITHLRQGHQCWDLTLLRDVNFSGLDCKLPVVHANDELLLALSRLGVGKSKLRLGLSNKYQMPQSLF